MALNPQFFNHDAQAGGFDPHTHVGMDIDHFHQSQNILIEGKRGTGKTHILKMIDNYYMLNFNEHKILPVYVSLAQISEHAKKDSTQFRMHLYTHIVERCIETVKKHKKQIREEDSLLIKALTKLKSLFNIPASSQVDQTLDEIHELAEGLRQSLEFDLSSFDSASSQFRNRKSGASFKSSVKAKSPTFDGNVSLNLESEEFSGEDFKNSKNYVGSKLAHQNSEKFLVEFLKQIQIILDLNHSLLLIDECSEASVRAQVEVFRLFKTIRGASTLLPDRQWCVFFIGTVYPRGQTYYPTRERDEFSFEPGQDCAMEFIQWDETDLETYIKFFEDMTLRRAKHFLDMKGDFNSVQKELFESEETFRLAAYCANGIPRRFWDFVKRGYDPSRNCVLKSHVEFAVNEFTNNQLLSTGPLSEKDVEYTNYLIDRLIDRNNDIRHKNNKKERKNNSLPHTIYLSIARERVKAFDRLIMQGVFHDKSRMRTKAKNTIQPILSLDMSIAYSFDLIPRKRFVKTLTTDLPRSPQNGFHQALVVKDYLERQPTTKKGSNPINDRDKSHAKKKERSDAEHFGIIEFERGSFGFIEQEETESRIYFQSRSIKHDYTIASLNRKRVRFQLKDKGSGREAINIYKA
ncbi:cold shock domain-containing protein [Cerasicoccus fimbriatus]|uniref:cold shock domain-containing protein n=1 Tax=Cerasicoccus fimbriatus TaxID=3014554 RepID=UPI0022B36DA2|nr:cold shock domain-containing protein [Cerasicoccus sp. TK19100]